MAARRGADGPLDWYGTRTVSWSSLPCGFCDAPSMDMAEGEAHRCRGEVAWYDKLWLCGCECNADWKPVAVVIEKDGSIGPVPEDLVIHGAVERRHRGKKKEEQSSSTENESE